MSAFPDFFYFDTFVVAQGRGISADVPLPSLAPSARDTEAGAHSLRANDGA